MARRETVSFYYSIGSRYSYLASTQIEALERATGCEVRWRPLYSVDLMTLRGRNPFAGEPVSGQYEWAYRRADAECWAEYYGVPYNEPEGVHFDARELARACVAASHLGAVRPYSRSLFSALHVEGVRQIDADECARRAAAVGLAPGQFADTVSLPSIDDELIETAREARAAGAFGVPTFVVRDRMFWGNDRLVLVQHYLKALARRN